MFTAITWKSGFLCTVILCQCSTQLGHSLIMWSMNVLSSFSGVVSINVLASNMLVVCSKGIYKVRNCITWDSNWLNATKPVTMALCSAAFYCFKFMLRCVYQEPRRSSFHQWYWSIYWTVTGWVVSAGIELSSLHLAGKDDWKKCCIVCPLFFNCPCLALRS